MITKQAANTYKTCFCLHATVRMDEVYESYHSTRFFQPSVLSCLYPNAYTAHAPVVRCEPSLSTTRALYPHTISKTLPSGAVHMGAHLKQPQ